MKITNKEFLHDISELKTILSDIHNKILVNNEYECLLEEIYSESRWKNSKLAPMKTNDIKVRIFDRKSNIEYNGKLQFMYSKDINKYILSICCYNDSSEMLFMMTNCTSIELI